MEAQVNIRDTRLLSLDFMKGFGIMSFILWHCYDYFYQFHYVRPPVNRFILYTTGIFVFMSGFVVGFHYLSKMRSGLNVARDIQTRLLSRAAKLALYVFLANLSLHVIVDKSVGIASVSETLHLMMTLFYVDRWDISFQILIVIAFGLFLSSLFIPLLLKHEKAFASAFIFILLIMIAVDGVNDGRFPYLWRYLPLSFIGLLFGIYMPADISRQALLKCSFVFSIIAIIMCSAAALSSSMNLYIISETGPYALLIISVFIAVGSAALYYYDIRHKPASLMGRSIMKMGQYSLMIYFAHFLIIRGSVLFIGANTFDSNMIVICLAALLAIISTVIAHQVDSLRRHPVFNRIYRLVFL